MPRAPNPDVTGLYSLIGERVRTARERSGVSREQLAARVKTTKTAISRLESGRHAPTVATLRKIASAFDGHLLIGFDVPPAKGRRARSRRELARV